MINISLFTIIFILYDISTLSKSIYSIFISPRIPPKLELFYYIDRNRPAKLIVEQAATPIPCSSRKAGLNGKEALGASSVKKGFSIPSKKLASQTSPYGPTP
jgi:hypothetical protein